MAEQLTILGAGLAGLAASQRARELGAKVDLYEKNGFRGGHANSQVFNGFIFDEGPHVSFTKNQVVKDLFANGLANKYREFASIVTNYWKGYWIKHPAQCNLFGLPIDLVERCLVDFVKARATHDRPINHYGDWLFHQFGETFSREFPYRYTRKYWSVEPEAMSTDWVGPRMYTPKIEDVIRGALAPNEFNHHYITQFRYPLEGGFGSYVDSCFGTEPVQFGYEVAQIDLDRRLIDFKNGKQAAFENLVSSLPLPLLVRLIKDAPKEVVEASEKLVCTALVLVDVGVARRERFPDSHWLYFYDEDISFARGSFPHLLAPSNAPEGCGSVQVEIYHTKFKPLPAQDMLSKAMEDLQKVGILFKDDNVLHAMQRHISSGNVLFNHDRAPSLACINDFLSRQGIFCCGRYGQWGYHWTDESITSGWEAAEKALAAVART